MIWAGSNTGTGRLVAAPMRARNIWITTSIAVTFSSIDLLVRSDAWSPARFAGRAPWRAPAARGAISQSHSAALAKPSITDRRVGKRALRWRRDQGGDSPRLLVAAEERQLRLRAFGTQLAARFSHSSARSQLCGRPAPIASTTASSVAASLWP